MSGTENDTLICLGVIIGAHGINGEVLIKSYTEHWEDIGTYGPLSNENGANRFELNDIRVTKKGVIAKIKGLRYRDEAEALKGQELFIPRSRLPENDEEETWYHTDLIGLDVYDNNGNHLGEVIALPNFGAGDLIEIKLLEDSKTTLIPFTLESVPVIDIPGRRIEIVLPEEE